MRPLCEEVFRAILPRSPYLNPDLPSNPFFHPLYLMRYGRRTPACTALLSSFRALLDNLVI